MKVAAEEQPASVVVFQRSAIVEGGIHRSKGYLARSFACCYSYLDERGVPEVYPPCYDAEEWVVEWQQV